MPKLVPDHIRGKLRSTLSSGGAVGGWPATLNTGLQYRFDASVASSLLLLGSKVTGWNDQSVNSFNVSHKETGWPDPTYTETGFVGGPAVLFAQPGSDPLTRPSVTIDYSGDHTISLVYEPHAPGTVFATAITHVNGSGPMNGSQAGFVLREDNAESWACSTIGFGDPRVKAASPPKTPQSILITLGPSIATYERNGTSVTTSPSAGSGTNTTGTLTIGAQSLIGVRASKAIAFAACWTRALSTEEKAALAAYLNTHWPI